MYVMVDRAASCMHGLDSVYIIRTCLVVKSVRKQVESKDGR